MSDDDRDHSSRASAGKSTGAIVLAVLLLAGYVGTYYATVRTVLTVPSPSLPPTWSSLSVSYRILIEVSPSYVGFPGWLPPHVAGSIFAPMHAIDRRIRPGFWDVPMLPAAIPVAPPPLTAPPLLTTPEPPGPMLEP